MRGYSLLERDLACRVSLVLRRPASEVPRLKSIMFEIHAEGIGIESDAYLGVDEEVMYDVGGDINGPKQRRSARRITEIQLDCQDTSV